MYYTIISRDEFIKLYRFGSIKINSNYLLKDNKNIETRLIKLFGILPLEYEESYIILKINGTIYDDSNFETIQSIYTLNIEKIKSVYTLSSEAQHFYKTKVNQKVNFEITTFTTILKEVIELKEKQDKERGIDILSKQFDFISKENVKRNLGNGFSDEFLKYKESFTVPFENFYLDLLSYKRENSFPKKDDIGFIYDLMIIKTLEKRTPETITKFRQGLLKLDASPAYQKLNNNKKETLFENIEFMSATDDEAIKKFTNNIGTTYLISGAIFLKIKYLLKEDNRNDNTQQKMLKVVDSFSNRYKDEISIALYLIGLVYGYKNLYNDYYDYLDLDIFKDSEITSIETIEKQKEIIFTDKKLKTLEEENQKLKLELKKMREFSEKETIQNSDDISVKEEEDKEISNEETIQSHDNSLKETKEIENQIILKSNLDNKQVSNLSIVFLREIAKDKEIKIKDENKKDIYKNLKEDKIRLYNKIFDIKEKDKLFTVS